MSKDLYIYICRVYIFQYRGLYESLGNQLLTSIIINQVSRPEIETARVKTREESQPYQAVAGIAKIIINEEDGESAEEKGSVSDGCGSDDSDESSGEILFVNANKKSAL